MGTPLPLLPDADLRNADWPKRTADHIKVEIDPVTGKVVQPKRDGDSKDKDKGNA